MKDNNNKPSQKYASPIAQSRVHLVGIGGIGMSGVAEILLGFGAKVTGSDLKSSERTQRLESLGAKIYKGHDASYVKEADVVVYSSAIDAKNPEILEAYEQKIPVISRAEALAELMRAKRGVAIAGTHGKTTTTSMLAAIFDSAERSPTVVSGGVVVKLGTNAQLGSGEWFIAEADESDGSFDRLTPEISVVTNIDNDHIAHYGSFDSLIESFFKFSDRIPFYGTVVYCGDDLDCKTCFSKLRKKTISYGFDDENEFCLKSLKHDKYSITHNGKELGSFVSPLPGDYNALNSLAAIVVALRAGLSFEEACKGIESFKGVQRRFDIKLDSEEKDLMIVDDYAHHPTEVSAVLSACKKKFLGARVKCVFQPHRYSRLEACWDQFLNAFDQSDELYLLPVYEAGEKPIKGYSSETLSKAVMHERVVFIDETDPKKVAESLKKNFKSGDLLITLGAGDVYKVSEDLAAMYSESEPSAAEVHR